MEKRRESARELLKKSFSAREILKAAAPHALQNTSAQEIWSIDVRIFSRRSADDIRKCTQKLLLQGDINGCKPPDCFRTALSDCTTWTRHDALRQFSDFEDEKCISKIESHEKSHQPAWESADD